MGIGRKQLTVAGSIAQALNVEFKTREAGPQGKKGENIKKGIDRRTCGRIASRGCRTRVALVSNLIRMARRPHVEFWVW